MPVLPGATTTVDPTAGAQAGGIDTITVIAPVATSADYRNPSTIGAFTPQRGHGIGGGGLSCRSLTAQSASSGSSKSGTTSSG